MFVSSGKKTYLFQQISRTYKITAGDPSKRGGSLSLDVDIAPVEGSAVQVSTCLHSVSVN